MILYNLLFIQFLYIQTLIINLIPNINTEGLKYNLNRKKSFIEQL